MTGFEYRRLIEYLVLPPGNIILLGILALLVIFITRRFRGRLLIFTLFLLWIFSTPWFAFLLLDQLQKPFAPLTEIPADADVIVLLGGGHYQGTNEFGGTAMPNSFALERVHYAAYLAQKTGLPIIASGGFTGEKGKSEASIMKKVLRNQFGIKTVIEEERSLNTQENAQFTKEVMRRNGLGRPLLVTHYWHMPRAIDWFRHYGIHAQAAPTARYTAGITERNIWRWIPQARSLFYSSIALHEFLGRLHYRYSLFVNGAPVSRVI